MKTDIILVCLALAITAPACEKIDDSSLDYPDAGESRETPPAVPLEELAEIFSGLPFGPEQMHEVSDAVGASVENGYDEEYTMADLFTVPGAGVGDDRLETRSGAPRKTYSRPMKDLLADNLKERFSTRGPDGPSAEEYMALLTDSDLQIYWPYSENWDGKTYPVITYDPADGSNNNVGYRLDVRSDGSREVSKVNVTEEFARENPVWVINRNDDAAYSSVELLRRQDPSWGTSGGSVVIKGTAWPDDDMKTLKIKNFKALRNYDSWFAGGSEFFIKCGSVEKFTASTEAEMKLYNPHVTDFMMEIRRGQVGKILPFNAILVTDWSPQMEKCAFLITEDDGGTRTTWKASIAVKFSSKSYGIEVNIPVNLHDDIVWRGSLSSKYIMKKNFTGRFGDVEIEFEVED